jgi:hemerythrin
MSKDITKKEILWKAEYIVNIEAIDKEHKNLFELSQKALEVNSELTLNSDKEDLKTILLKLLKYLKIHFINEQNYMKSVNYPDYENHLLLHKYMVEELINLIKNIDKYNFKETETLLYEFIKEYFLNHIMTEDKKIAIWNTPTQNLKDRIAWKDIYKVNNQFIDKEHQVLFDIAREAVSIKGTHQEKVQKLKTIISKLYDYMKTHFKNEEKHMKSIKYPKLEEHIKFHEGSIISLNNFIKRIPTIHIDEFEKELVKMIDITLLQHIIQEDRKIIQWEKTNKKQQTK